MSEEKEFGIKESLELLDGLELVGVAGVKIAKGGLGVEDFAHVVELAKNSDKIVEAGKGLNLVDDEMKDLDEAELLKLGSKAFSMIKNIIKASK